jgi:hypothetical protein
VYQLSSVFLEMYPFYPYFFGLAVITNDLKMSVFTKGPFILGYLISLGEIRIKVVFSGEPGLTVYVAIEGKTRANGVFNGLFIEHGQRARLTGANRADLAVGRGVIQHPAITE